jgi:hypothetical protein
VNFATPALILLLLALPGVIFRWAYLRGCWESHPFKRTSIAEEIGYSAAISVALHVCAIGVLSTFRWRFDIEAMLSLLFGPAAGNPAFESSLRVTADSFYLVLLYLAVLYICAWLGGHGLHRAVRFGRIDIQSRTLRFNHPWHYLFTGEILDFDRMHGPFPSSSIECAFVAALLEQGDELHLYRGTLGEVHYDKDGELHRLILEYPQRAKLSDVESEEGQGEQGDVEKVFHQINGRYFVLFAAEIKNINIQYAMLPEARSQ